MALINKLSAIGDAIREKTGKENLLTLDQMPEEIKGISGGGEEIEPIVLSGNCDYACAGPLSGEFIKLYGNKISTKNITSSRYMFYYNTKIEEIPFEINLSTASSLTNMFFDCRNLKTINSINSNGTTKVSGSNVFKNCYQLNSVVFNNFNITGLGYAFENCYNLNQIKLNNTTLSNLTTGDMNYSFSHCYSLKELPENLFDGLNPAWTNYRYSIYYGGFYYCCVLNSITDIPVGGTFTSNSFNEFVLRCYRLKDLTFTNRVSTANWKNQTIDLSGYVGYAPFPEEILNYNSGITADKEVKDDATYQALKNDPDWYSCKSAYSRYNHDSAVATINSLPDTSAYLATAGGTNTIKFKGNAGSLTDGGAINTLTEEEITVATNKGWTITFV